MILVENREIRDKLHEDIEMLRSQIAIIKDKHKEYDKLLVDAKASDDYTFIRDIGSRFKLKFNKSDFYKALCKEILLGRIRNEIKKLKTNATELEYEIVAKKNDIESLTICPQCGGKGVIIESKYHREDGQINQITHMNKCLKCSGTGKI